MGVDIDVPNLIAGTVLGTGIKTAWDVVRHRHETRWPRKLDTYERLNRLLRQSVEQTGWPRPSEEPPPALDKGDGFIAVSADIDSYASRKVLRGFRLWRATYLTLQVTWSETAQGYDSTHKAEIWRDYGRSRKGLLAAVDALRQQISREIGSRWREP